MIECMRMLWMEWWRTCTDLTPYMCDRWGRVRDGQSRSLIVRRVVVHESDFFEKWICSKPQRKNVPLRYITVVGCISFKSRRLYLSKSSTPTNQFLTLAFVTGILPPHPHLRLRLCEHHRERQAVRRQWTAWPSRVCRRDPAAGKRQGRVKLVESPVTLSIDWHLANQKQPLTAWYSNMIVVIMHSIQAHANITILSSCLILLDVQKNSIG